MKVTSTVRSVSLYYASRYYVFPKTIFGQEPFFSPTRSNYQESIRPTSATNRTNWTSAERSEYTQYILAILASSLAGFYSLGDLPALVRLLFSLFFSIEHPVLRPNSGANKTIYYISARARVHVDAVIIMSKVARTPWGRSDTANFLGHVIDCMCTYMVVLSDVFSGKSRAHAEPLDIIKKR